ncbi:MAG: hypothetical protein ACRDZ4_10960 [Egibacteraceae bacterium]
MSLIYQLFTGTPAQDLNTTGVKLIVPMCESLKIVEYGFISTATDPGATGVLKLQYVDGAASPNTVDLDSFTVPTAAAVGDIVSQRVDILVDKLLDKYLASVSGTPGTLTSEADGFVAVQLNVTTAFGAGVTGTVYMKAAMAGTQKGPATSQTLVTTI